MFVRQNFEKEGQQLNFAPFLFTMLGMISSFFAHFNHQKKKFKARPSKSYLL
jgi:uncharacterized membrane protein